MTAEILVPEEEVQEYLGISEPTTVPADEFVGGLDVSVNVGLLNALGSKWANVRDVERMLRVFGDNNDIPLLHSVADQLVGASGLNPRRRVA